MVLGKSYLSLKCCLVVILIENRRLGEIFSYSTVGGGVIKIIIYSVKYAAKLVGILLKYILKSVGIFSAPYLLSISWTYGASSHYIDA